MDSIIKKDKLLEPTLKEKVSLGRMAPSQMVDIQNGAVTVNSTDLNSLRQQILLDTMRNSNGDNVGAENVMRQLSALKSSHTLNKIGQNQQVLKLMNALDPLIAGRGVTKSLESPAQRLGYFPHNPAYFNMQMPTAQPIQNAVRDRQNFRAVLAGYQNNTSINGLGQLVQQMQHKEQLIHEMSNKQYEESVYEGVPKSQVVNLHNIHLKNTRQNSIYAFY